MRLPGPRQFPKKLKIRDTFYSVHFAKPDNRKALRRGDMGLCDSKAKEIVLSLDQGKLQMMETFIHELLHAFEFEYNIKIKHKTIYELEQPIVNFISANLKKMKWG